MCRHAVKKRPSVIRLVPDRYKTRQMCDKAIFENGATLKIVPDATKIKKCVIK